MNAELTELVFILDRSGSMGGLESDTIGGFNGMIARQKKEGEKINVTTVLFDDEVEIVHDRFPIEIIEPLTDKEKEVVSLRILADLPWNEIGKITGQSGDACRKRYTRALEKLRDQLTS